MGDDHIMFFFQMKDTGSGKPTVLSGVRFENIGNTELTRFGGAIAVRFESQQSGTLTIKNSSFVNCSAAFGAAIYVRVSNDKPNLASKNFPIRIVETAFVKNTARHLGVLYFEDTSVKVVSR